LGENMARLDAVQLKVNLLGPQATRAAAELGLASAPRREGEVFFGERVLPGGWGLPLYERGLIVRVRAFGASAESTVKLRPCRRGRLTPRWLSVHRRGGERFRLEEDWSDDRLLVASLDAESVAGRQLLTPAQRDFVAECADVELPLAGLVLLGPVRVTDYGRIIWHGYDVAAQRWAIPGVSAPLELTLREDPPSAEVVWRGFRSRLAQCGIEPAGGERKTRLLLDQLARASRRP